MTPDDVKRLREARMDKYRILALAQAIPMCDLIDDMAQVIQTTDHAIQCGNVTTPYLVEKVRYFRNRHHEWLPETGAVEEDHVE